jgi:hypothetical protein
MNESGDSLLPIDEGTPLMVGMPVVASDGESLGTVDGVAGDRFKVAALLAQDYWLPRNLIAGMAPGGDIVVAVRQDDVDAAKVDGPDEG